MESHQWVVLVQQSLEEPSESADGHIIYPRVPKSLKSKNTETSYIPEGISFGPYHFQETNPLLDEIEVLKSDVARKYNNRLNGGLSTLVQDFMGEDALIRKIYGREFSICIPPDVFSWMIVRDGCFLMEILSRFADKIVQPKNDGIFGREIYQPLLNAIVKDMFKIENQLPLWVLQKIVPEWPQAKKLFESALKNLSPIEVIIEDKYSKYNKHHHILHMFHDYIVDEPSSKRDCGRHVTVCQFLGSLVSSVFKLLVLSPVVILNFAWFMMSLIWGLYQSCITDQSGTQGTHNLTVEELRKIGVKFKKLENRGIHEIKFEESNSTLHLPKFKVDDRSEVMLRNLMAFEIYYGCGKKPITRYALLMNDLVNTSADVAILRRYDIITSKLGSDDDLAQLWNSLVATEMPTYEPIDKAASRINCYRKKRWKILWAQFKMVHFSKPWLVLSLLGGISLLMLTVVQVACLFRNCQIK